MFNCEKGFKQNEKNLIWYGKQQYISSNIFLNKSHIFIVKNTISKCIHIKSNVNEDAKVQLSVVTELNFISEL